MRIKTWWKNLHLVHRDEVIQFRIIRFTQPISGRTSAPEWRVRCKICGRERTLREYF